ncbi:bifunctional riboflavin kinase/FAD synthetase [Nocardioides humi]|uniref:FAD synthase n=1 Tax=Nocardioides humi TaxID=449461 RepID=A0ABN2BTV4_9ACTN|nr:bifunctional riboflavin kinase/FAD synthetase [Nocardioides humi]
MTTLSEPATLPEPLDRLHPGSSAARDLRGTPLVVGGARVGSVYTRRSEPWTGGGAALTIGQFDGVHRGHQHLLGLAAEEAARLGVLPGAVTFDRHPRSVLDAAQAPRFLTRADDKVQLLLHHGAAFVAVLTATAPLLRMRPGEFVEDVLLGALGARGVVVGPNFRFGHRATGDVAVLREYGAAHGFDVRVPALVTRGGDAVSSSAVRAAIDDGAMRAVAAMLGRPYEVRGLLVPNARGRLEVTLPRAAATPPPDVVSWVLRSAGRDVVLRYVERGAPW